MNNLQTSKKYEMKHLIFLFSLFCLVVSLDLTAQDNNEVVSVKVECEKHDMTVTISGLLAQNLPEDEPPERPLPPPKFDFTDADNSGNDHRQNNLIAQNLAQDGDPPNGNEQVVQIDEPLNDDGFLGNLWGLIKNNWGAAILAFMGFLKVIVNLTPTEKDNVIFAWLDNLINKIVPNLRKGGGRHPPVT